MYLRRCYRREDGKRPDLRCECGRAALAFIKGRSPALTRVRNGCFQRLEPRQFSELRWHDDVAVVRTGQSRRTRATAPADGAIYLLRLPLRSATCTGGQAMTRPTSGPRASSRSDVW